MSSPALALVRGIANQVSWPTPPPPGPWIEANVKFAGSVESSPRYLLAKSPYAAPILNWWTDPEVEEIILLWATQSGKTSTILALLAYLIGNDPGPTMLASAEKDPLDSLITMRVKPCLRATFPKLVPQGGHQGSWLKGPGVEIGATHLWPAWATSLHRCRQQARRYVLGDETAIWRLPRQYLAERTKNFLRNRKMLWATTPTTEDESTWADALSVFRLHRWEVQCPLCQAWQVLEFARLNYAACRISDTAWDLEAVERDTTYRCAACERDIPQAHRPAMIAAGRAVCVTPDRSPRRCALRVTALDAPATTWGMSARVGLECAGNTEATRTYWEGWRVEPYQVEALSVRSARVMLRRLEMQPQVLPENTRYLLAGADPGKHHVWATVRAWLADGRSVLVWCGRLESDSQTGALNALWTQVAERTWQRAGHPDGMRVQALAIDSGYESRVVYDCAARHPNRVYPMKGNDGKIPWRWSWISRSPDGKPLPGSGKLYQVSDPVWREHVIRSYQLGLADTGAWLIGPDIPPEYGDHLEAWQIISQKTKSGAPRAAWRQVRQADHYMDCEKYCAALHDIVGETIRVASTVQPRRYGRIGTAFGGGA